MKLYLYVYFYERGGWKMKNFIISTDSTVDLPKSYLEENNISIHPLYYYIDDEE